MKNKITILIMIAAIGLLLAACVPNANDVPSLEATPTAVLEEEILDDESKVMAFVQCMRAEGIEFKDPVVDSDGNVQQPEFVEGVTYTREELAAPFEVCGKLIEGLTRGRERRDMSERLDQFVALAACLRDKDYDVDDPTAETFEQWATDFRMGFDWDDPDAMEAYEDCSSEWEGDGK